MKKAAEVARVVDNPGGGDCGFYAFSIGLVAIIQDEYLLKQESPTFKKWETKGLNSVELNALLAIDLQNLSRTRSEPDLKLLFALQMSLRTIVAEASKHDLLDRMSDESEKKKSDENVTLVEGSPIFHKFVEIVDHYRAVKPQTLAQCDKLDQFNELALSEPIRALAQIVAKDLGPERTFSPEDQKKDNCAIKKAFMSKENKDCILSGVMAITQQGRWATHSDLNVVAAALEVNLVVTDQANGQSLENQPTVTLNNGSNAHWTTTVPDRRAACSKPSSKAVDNVSDPILDDYHSSESYKRLLVTLSQFASKQGRFSTIRKEHLIQIDDDLDAAEAKHDENETDEDFALRLQEAEYRRSRPK